MKPALTLEKVLKEVKHLELPRRISPLFFQSKQAQGPASLAEVELPLKQLGSSLESRRAALHQELEDLIQAQHPLRVFWRKQIQPWFKRIFWVE